MWLKPAKLCYLIRQLSEKFCFHHSIFSWQDKQGKWHFIYVIFGIGRALFYVLFEIILHGFLMGNN